MGERLHVLEWQERTARIVYEGKPLERTTPVDSSSANYERHLERAAQMRAMIERGLSTKTIASQLDVASKFVREMRFRMKRESSGEDSE